jgi:hypothetical protein
MELVNDRSFSLLTSTIGRTCSLLYFLCKRLWDPPSLFSRYCSHYPQEQRCRYVNLNNASAQCRGHEWLEPCLHSLICVPGVHMDNFTVTATPLSKPRRCNLHPVLLQTLFSLNFSSICCCERNDVDFCLGMFVFKWLSVSLRVCLCLTGMCVSCTAIFETFNRLCDWPIPIPEKSYRVFMCLSVMKPT